MKYEVTYRCGHSGTEQIYGKTSEHARKVAWIERTKVCPDCYRKAKEAEREAEDASPVTVKMTMLSSRCFATFFGGTSAAKDDIKSLGAKWTEDHHGGDRRKRWEARFDSQESLARFLVAIDALGYAIDERSTELDWGNVIENAKGICNA